MRGLMGAAMRAIPVVPLHPAMSRNARLKVDPGADPSFRTSRPLSITVTPAASRFAPGDNPMSVRLLPDLPLPSSPFVPGRAPHPFSDPAGHSFGQRETEPTELDPDQWMRNRVYLRGLDLFNAGYYWESHVEFES